MQEADLTDLRAEVVFLRHVLAEFLNRKGGTSSDIDQLVRAAMKDAAQGGGIFDTSNIHLSSPLGGSPLDKARDRFRKLLK